MGTEGSKQQGPAAPSGAPEQPRLQARTPSVRFKVPRRSASAARSALKRSVSARPAAAAPPRGRESGRSVGRFKAVPSKRQASKVRLPGSARSRRSKTPALSRAPTGRPPGKPAEPTRFRGTTVKGKVAIQKRAESRSKVPSKFTDSLKYFCFSPTGLLKILRMILIVAAVICFTIAQANESFIAITVQEACIVLFFILIYMVSLQYLLICLHWPLFDLINSFISVVFLLVVALFTMQEKKRRQLLYIGGVLCLAASVLCFIDALVVTAITIIDSRKQAEEIESTRSRDLEPGLTAS